MANKFPLVFDSTGKSLQELPTGDNLDLTGSSVLNAIDISGTGTLTINTVNAQNMSVGGTALSAVAISNDYNDLNNKPTLFSGDYNDLNNKPSSISSDWADITNKPVIASKLSQLTNDTNFVSNAQINIIPTQVTGLADIATSGSFNDLSDVPNYVTNEQIAGGTLTVELKNTGDLIGSVFSDDSSLIVDHLTSTVNANTVNTDILTANIVNSEDYNHRATGNINIRTDEYLTLQSTSFRLFNTLSGTEIYDVDQLTIRGDVNFGLANVFGLSLDNFSGNLTGSVFSDDSSLIVDGISREIFANKIEANSIVGDDIVAASLVNNNNLPLNISGDTAGITMSPGGPLNIPNASNITINATNSISIEASGNLTLTSSSGIVDFPEGTSVNFDGATVTGLTVTGDFTGSVFADNSTQLVDGIAGKIVGRIETDEAVINSGIYDVTVNSTGAKIQKNGNAGLEITNSGGVVLGGNSPTTIATTSDTINIANGTSGNLNLGSGTNIVKVTNNTTLDLSDLTSILFSNSPISGLQSPSISYTPNDNTDWEGNPPDNVQDAIDRLVAWITDFKNNDSTDPNRPAP